MTGANMAIVITILVMKRRKINLVSDLTINKNKKLLVQCIILLLRPLIFKMQTNKKQEESYESDRISQEFDPDYSDNDASINSIDHYGMDHEQADHNCDESDDSWVEFV